MASAKSPKRARRGESTTLLLSELLAEDAASIATQIGDASCARPVLSVEFYDAATTDSTAAGVLLLLPSWQAMKATALRNIAATALQRGVCAIVVQGGAEADLVEAFTRDLLRQLPVLQITPEITWREFEAGSERAIGEHAPGITPSLLQSDYLYAIADTIAEVFGGSVSVENHARTLLAYSTVAGQVVDEFRAEGIRTRQVPESVLNFEQYRLVLRTDGPVRFPQYGEELPRAAIAIRAGSMQLGTIWAIDPEGHDADQPLSAERREVLERGAQSAAAHLLASWRVTEADTRRREQALERLLNEDEPSADDLAIVSATANDRMRLVAMRFAADTAGPGDLRQLLVFCERQLHARLSLAASVVAGDTAYFAVLGATGARLRDAMSATLRACSRVFTAPIQSAIGGETTAAAGLRTSRAETDAILRLPHDPDHPVRSSADVSAALLADQLVALFAQHPHLRHPALREPATDRRDVERRSTLLAWFEHGGASGAATALRVHENTVRYRVQQTIDDWRVRLDDPDEAFALWASLVAERAQQRAAARTT